MSTPARERADLLSLPRPLRDPELLRQLNDLDTLHQIEKRSGSFTVEVHYSLGNPRKVWVRTSTELHLNNSTAGGPHHHG